MKIKELKKSIAAGMLISISVVTYLSCPNKLLGAFMFTFGLFAICMFDLNLFTGKIGYCNCISNKSLFNYFVIWEGNLIGCVIIAILIRIMTPSITETATELVLLKFNKGIPEMIISGILCGALMFIAVENYNQNQSELAKMLGLFLCVSTFIINGFEHSIADIGFCALAVSDMFMVYKALLLIIIVTLSNALGAIACRYMIRT